jgi:hypothetical protein
MAGYPPDVIRDFVERFGSIAKAEEKARAVPGFGEEIHRVEAEIVWLKGAYLHPPRDELEKLEDKRRSLVVEALAPLTPAGPAQKPKPGRGRRDKDVSVLEANRAARIYVANGGATDYGVHELYKEELAADGIAYDAKTGPHLSRPMVAHLMAAIDSERLPWDPAQKSLRISDEFRTRRGRFVIPRRDAARKAKT